VTHQSQGYRVVGVMIDVPLCAEKAMFLLSNLSARCAAYGL